jgi:drug/metabolite transporter (DMT)-like permease
MRPYLFALPALLDVCGSFLNFTALAFVAASTYQILKMLQLVFVVLLSIAIFKRKYSWGQWLGVLFVIVGLSVVSYVSITAKSEGTDQEANDEKNQSAEMGIIFMVVG